MHFINVGFGNAVSAERIVVLASPDSSPVKRLVSEAKEAGRAIDVSCGHKTRSVIVTDSEHVILSALTPDKISERLGMNVEMKDGEAD